MRVGIGYDIHKLVDSEESNLILAGVPIPFKKKCVAHSDGDVAVHALIDALLGATALGDIGTHFPDTDPIYKNADSALLLQKCCKLVKETGFCIENVDMSIIAEKPKLAPYILQMRNRLAELMNMDVKRISIKAKTNEQLDAVGREDAVATHAVVLVHDNP